MQKSIFEIGKYTVKTTEWGNGNIAVYLYRGKEMIYCNCHSEEAIDNYDKALKLIYDVEGMNEESN